MLLVALLPLAQAADLTWTCHAIAQPADALPYRPSRDGLGAADAGRVAYAALLERIDAACISDCADPERDCPARSCTTAAGDTVEWEAASSSSSDATSSSSSRTVRVVVTPPSDAGLSWTWAEVTWTQSDGSSSSSSWSSGETWSASWLGTLDAAWPSDGAFTAADRSSSSDLSEEWWDDGTCRWSAREDVAGNVQIWVNGTSVWVSSPWEAIACGDFVGMLGGTWATVDGVFGGLVDVDTWATLVGTDADGDGWFAEHGDCDDADASIECLAREFPYDGIDQDCSGADLRDADGDGYEGDGGPDCDDTSRSVHPGAEDHDIDGLDADCDGFDGVDADGDGWAPTQDGRRPSTADDCDDHDPTIHPFAEETWRDGIDSNCDEWDGIAAEDADQDGWPVSEDCDPADPAVNPGAQEPVGRDRVDQDCDGVDGPDPDGDGFDAFDDCDPTNANAHPDATDVPGDGVDQDCDGTDAQDTGTGERIADDAGCGCGSGGSASGWLAVAMAALAAQRRHRA